MKTLTLRRRSRGDRYRVRFTRVALALALPLAAVAAVSATATPAEAATSQFRGVNWADANDNFIKSPNIPVGLNQSDSYATTYKKATAILKGFQALGANTVRMGINTWTTSSTWWNSLTGAYDAASALGMKIIITPWLQGGKVSDTTAYYNMWNVVIDKYGKQSNIYFGVLNEPYGMGTTALADFEAGFLAHYPSVPRGRIILPGTGNDTNVCPIGADSRLTGTLLSLHLYSMFRDSDKHTTEAAWVSDIKGRICSYASRTVITEFGVPMTTGVDYNGPKNGSNNVSYFYAMTDTARSLKIGAVLWVGLKTATQTTGPGPCDNASCAITSLQGSGTNLSVKVTNRSGLDRLQWAWGTGTNPGGNG